MLETNKRRSALKPFTLYTLLLSIDVLIWDCVWSIAFKWILCCVLFIISQCCNFHFISLFLSFQFQMNYMPLSCLLLVFNQNRKKCNPCIWYQSFWGYWANVGLYTFDIWNEVSSKIQSRTKAKHRYHDELFQYYIVPVTIRKTYTAHEMRIKWL